MADNEQGTGNAVDHRRHFYLSLRNGEQFCFVCLATYEDGAQIVYPGTCLGHFLHRKCHRKLLQKNFGCPVCRKPYDATERNNVVVYLTLPTQVDISHSMAEILPSTTGDKIGNLIGRRVPCCSYPFIDEEFAVFPEPCKTHPVHSACYIIDRLGDGTQSDVKRAIFCPYPQCGIQYHGENIVCRHVLDVLLDEELSADDEEEPFADDEEEELQFVLD